MLAPVPESVTACLAPLCRLHDGQARHRLSRVVSPPWLTGTMWSTSKVVTVSASGVWQYAHRPLSISCTWARKAAGIVVPGTSVSLCFPNLLQCVQGTRFQDIHRVDLGQELVQFVLFILAQVPFTIALQQVCQAFPVAR